MFQSVFVKIYLQMALLFAAMLVALIIAIGLFVQDQNENKFQQIANAQAKSIIAHLKNEPISSWPEKLEKQLIVFPLEVEGIVNKLTPDWEPVDDLPGLFFNKQDSQSWKVARQIDERGYYLKISEIPEPLDVLEVWESTLPIALLFIFFGLGFYKLAKKIRKPVDQIIASTISLTRGDFSVRLNDSEFDEPFKTLCHRFNTMTEVVENSILDQKVIIGAIPHELRTPLSRLRFALDLLQPIDSLQRIKAELVKIDGHMDALEATVSDTLEFNRLQLKTKISSQTFSLEDLMQKVCNDYLNDSNIKILFEIHSLYDDSPSGNELLLKRAIINLIDNAIRHANLVVQVRAFRTERSNLTIEIHDDGPGISPEQQPLLFIPFSRADASRSRSTGGIGLGLAFVDLIMRKHEGKVGYRDSDLGGSAFYIEWPAFSKTLLTQSQDEPTQS